MNKDFYEDEVIEGFYVPAMLKMAWGAQMDVLKETDAICRRHNIPYFADWGTLLAAIRHNGYIPWDDDLDISMRRSDYERFLRYAEDELPEGFKVMHFKNHPGHHFFVARIVGKPRICFEEEHLIRFHGFPYIVGVDLFVLDNVCRDRSKEHIKSITAEYVITVADTIADNDIGKDEREEMLSQCEAYTGRAIDRSLEGEDLRVSLYGLAEALFASIPDEEADALVQMMPYGMYGNQVYIPKEYYRSTVRLPYMDTTISVPLCYDTVMRRKFGNYMQIHRSWDGHDYPFFYGQHRDLLAVLDFEYPAYKAGREDVIAAKPVITEDTDNKGDVCFLPFASKHWKYMEKTYRHFQRSGYRVHVVPLPYYYKAWDGSAADEVFDVSGYPEDITIEDYKTFDPCAIHPSKIVIQNPFDEWNPVMTIPQRFYSSNLKKFTDELIYVPFFVTDDFSKENGPEYVNMDHYVCMPGVINADRIILPTETLKKTYIDKITEFAGSEDDEVFSALDKKIEVRPELVCCNKTVPADDANEKIGKKTVVFFTTVSFLAENGEKAIAKIGKVLDVFEENREKIKVLWISQCIRDNTELLDGSVAEGFEKLSERFLRLGIGEYEEDPDRMRYKAITAGCDAYYGDPSALALRFYYEHKPVMLINADAV